MQPITARPSPIDVNALRTGGGSCVYLHVNGSTLFRHCGKPQISLYEGQVPDAFQHFFITRCRGCRRLSL